MLTNTERQAIVDEVNAGTYGIDEALDDIAAAQKGEEVRKALYAEALVLNREGHAGSTDVVARQQIANLQTTVSGKISTLRTEVGEDIADLETALNSGLATQNGRIAAQDATIANVVANYNIEYGSTELWASTGETGALAAGTTVTLSEDVSHFDYIDIYSFLGNNNILDTLPVDAKLQSNDGYALRWVNLSDPGSGTYEAYVRIIETKIKIIGTTLTIIHQVTYSNGASVSISGAEITQSNRSTYVGELGIMKVVGRKITSNTELEDVRIGADGTEYESAGQAVRAQVTALESAIPAVDSTLNTQGAAADAKVVGELKADLDDLNEFCHKEIVDITTGSRSVTSGIEVNKNPALVNCDIPSGTTYKFTLNSNGCIGTFYLYANESRIRNDCVSETAYEFTASQRITVIGIYANATNVIGTGTITGVISIATPTENSLEERIGTLSGLDTTDKSNLVSAINEVKNNSPVVPLPPKDTTFFHVSKNMIDPSACVAGEYVNQDTGAFGTSSAHIRTDYIEIEPSTDYVFRSVGGAFGANFRYVFYKDDKTRISGAVGALPSMVMTSPANAKYVVISDTAYSGRNLMIAPYVNEDKTFEYFDNVYVLPQYVVDGDADDIILNVPSKVYALVGYETNIYFENITEDWTKYNWDATCTKGMQLERGYRITPTASDVGTYTLTIRASISVAIYKEVSTTLVVTSASAGNGQTKTVIVLGDSTTDNGTVISKLHDNFSSDVMSVTTLGTRGTAPNNHEGRSGWKIADYFTKASITYTDGRGTIYNPFYNPSTETFDASYYFTNSGIAIPDVFIVNMGINDVFGYLTDAEYESGVTTILQRVETAIQSILDATTTTKVCVCLTIPPNHNQDAFGKAYACGQTRNRYKRNNTLWVQSLIENFSDRESERVYIIPINACLDTVYNMGLETLPVNARNTDATYQSPISNGGVHPVASGYWQIADVYTAFLKAQAN